MCVCFSFSGTFILLISCDGRTGRVPAGDNKNRGEVMELSEKVKELVAVGASITANCQPCLQYHMEKALASGADSGEITAAIDVGKQVRKGASAKMDQFSSSLKDADPVPAGAAGSPCCG